MSRLATADPRSLPASYILSQAVDPASVWPGAPPNFGEQVVPHIVTVSGRIGTKAYQWADEALRDSHVNAEKMRTDCGIMECVEARQRAVSLLNWHIVPEDDQSLEQKQLADEMTRIVRRTPNFTKMRWSLSDCHWYGRAGVAPQYGKDWVGGHMRTVVRRWEPRHGDKLVFRWDDGSGEFDPDQVGIRITAGYHEIPNSRFKDSLGQEHDLIEGTQYGLVRWFTPKERQLLIVDKHIIEDAPFEDPIRAGAIHGVGIRDRIYWTWYGMIECLADVLSYLERSAFGVEIWKYPAGNNVARQRCEDAAKRVTSGGRTVLIVPAEQGEGAENFGVEHIEPGLGGVEQAMSVIKDFFGHKIKRYILGQILTSEAAGTGLGSGVADAHMATFADIVKFDAIGREETLTTDFLRPLQLWNFPKSRGIFLRFVIDTESPDADRKMQGYRSAWDMGARLKEEEVLSIIGASMPKATDRVLQNPQMAQQAMQIPGAGMDGAGMGQGQPTDELHHLFGPLADLVAGGQPPSAEGGSAAGPPGFDNGGPPQSPPAGGGPAQYASPDAELERYAHKSLPGQQTIAWDESDHARVPAGSPEGGEFTAAVGSKGFKIHKVEDTRQYEEVADDVWKPIPGSGKVRNCDRCGREHEVHYHVKCHATGKDLTLGGSCAVQTGIADEAKHKSIMSAAKTKRRIEAELESTTAKWEEMKAAKTAVDSLEPPIDKISKVPDDEKKLKSTGRDQWSMEDAMIWADPVRTLPGEPAKSSLTPERRKTLIDDWRERRFMERIGAGMYRWYSINTRKQDLEKRLASIDKRMKSLTEEAEESQPERYARRRQVRSSPGQEPLPAMGDANIKQHHLWKEQLHPRAAKGAGVGGQFVEKAGGPSHPHQFGQGMLFSEMASKLHETEQYPDSQKSQAAQKGLFEALAHSDIHPEQLKAFLSGDESRMKALQQHALETGQHEMPADETEPAETETPAAEPEKQGPEVDAKHQAIGKRFGIPPEAVRDVLETHPDELARRDKYLPPSSSRDEAVGPTLDYEQHPHGTAKIDNSRHSTGETDNAYVDYLREFDPHELKTSEHEDGMNESGSVKQYAEWAKSGLKPPPISVFDSSNGNGDLVSTNRRRVLAARQAGTPITGWHGATNPETGLPLKYGDVHRAAEEHDRSGLQSAERADVEQDELRSKVKAGYKGPESVSNGQRQAGFTDNPQESKRAKGLGLHVEKRGQFHVYGQSPEHTKELGDHLETHGYGDTPEKQQRLSELAGYSESERADFGKLMGHPTPAAKPSADEPFGLQQQKEKLGLGLGAEDKSPEISKGRQESFFHGMDDAPGQGKLFGGLDLLGGKASAGPDLGAEREQRAGKITAAGKLMAEHGKELPKLEDMHGHVGEHLTKDEYEQLLKESGVDPINAANEAFEQHAKHGDKIATATAVIASRHLRHVADRDGRRAEALKQAGDSSVVEFTHGEKPDRKIVVHPSAQKPGKWQLTQMDERGPSGHTNHDTREEAIASAVGAHPKGGFHDDGGEEYKISATRGGSQAAAKKKGPKPPADTSTGFPPPVHGSPQYWNDLRKWVGHPESHAKHWQQTPSGTWAWHDDAGKIVSGEWPAEHHGARAHPDAEGLPPDPNEKPDLFDPVTTEPVKPSPESAASSGTMEDHAREAAAKKVNIWSHLKSKGIDYIKDLTPQERKDYAEAARQAAKPTPKPSEARQRAMDRQREVNPPAGEKRQETYINGDRGEYTGKMVDGMHEVEMMEGRHAGKTKVTARGPDGSDPYAERNRKEWQEQQAGFRKLHEGAKPADDLKTQIRNFLGKGSVGPRGLRDIRHAMGHKDVDPENPQANAVNKAIREMRDAGELEVTQPRFGDPSVSLKAGAKSGEAPPIPEGAKPPEPTGTPATFRWLGKKIFEHAGAGGTYDTPKHWQEKARKVAEANPQNVRELADTLVNFDHMKGYKIGKAEEEKLGKLLEHLKGKQFVEDLPKVSGKAAPPDIPKGAAPHSKSPEAPAEASAVGASSPMSLATVSGHSKSIRSGEASAEQIRQWFEDYHGNQAPVRAELQGKSVADLKKMGAGGYRAAGMKKAELVDDLLSKIGQQYHVGESLHWQPHAEKHIDALRRAVHAQTDDDVKSFAGKVKASQAEREERRGQISKALTNPETLDEFDTFVRGHGKEKLSDEQLARYDDLKASGRRAKASEQRSTVRGFSGGEQKAGAIGIVEGHHQKRNAHTYTVTVGNRLGDDGFREALSRAKTLGGSYVNAMIAKRYGATAGFQFFDRASADHFSQVLKGESVDRSEAEGERKAERIENASERLAALAQSTHEAADEELGRDRLTNTSKRAGQAASAEASARSQKALAETMERLSGAMAEGQAKHLEGIRNRKHVEELNWQLRNSRHQRMKAEKANDLPYDEREEFNSRPPEADDIRHVEYPHPKIWGSQLQQHAAEFENEPGLKLIAARLKKAATAQVKFKGQGNGFKFSGGRVLSPKDLETVRIHGLAEGKGVRVHQSHDYRLAQQGKGNGPFYTADGGKTFSPTPDIAVNAAANRGHALDIVDLPQDELITLDDPREIADLSSAVSKLRRSSNRDLRRVAEELHSRLDSYNRLQAMDIKDDSDLRAALREYLPLRTKPKGEDKIKKLERELVGKKIEGFFPTPRPLIERMIDAAGIESGHSVLEPSAGKGDILDAVRDRHPDASTEAIEPVSTLRDIIEAKGHNLAGRDFLEHKGEYDRVLMNPPFEKGQDAEHVQHAFGQLKAGGRLVAVMSAGPFQRSDKKSEAFREWLESVGGSFEDLPEGSFSGKDAFRQTGVNTKLVVIDK